MGAIVYSLLTAGALTVETSFPELLVFQFNTNQKTGPVPVFVSE